MRCPHCPHCQATARAAKAPREVTIQGDTASVPCAKAGEFVYALVDAVDAAFVAGFRWCIDGSGYPSTWDKETRRVRRMHKMIRPDLGMTDHVNRNKLDNRRSNLRETSAQANVRNRGTASTNKSGVRGVHWHALKKKWHAQVKVNGKSKHLGYFDSLEEAASVATAARAGWTQ